MPSRAHFLATLLAHHAPLDDHARNTIVHYLRAFPDPQHIDDLHTIMRGLTNVMRNSTGSNLDPIAIPGPTAVKLADLLKALLDAEDYNP